MAEYRTEQKKLLLDFLKANSENSYTIEEIIAGLGDNSIGKSTVYRQLARLCEQGLLRRFESTDADGLAVHVYQYVSPEQNCAGHFHLKCQRCGRVSHADADLTERISAQVGAEYGFLVDCGASMLYGLCAVCREQTKGEL